MRRGQRAGQTGNKALAAGQAGPQAPQLAPLSFGIGALPLGWDANSWPDLFLPGAPLPLGLGLTDPFGYASVTVPNPNPGGLTGVTALVQGVGIRAGALELSAPVVLQLQ